MPVQPHPAVICVTCGSRLKVIDRRLIGGIANCPKCGAMVQITPEAITSEREARAGGDGRPRLAIGPQSGIDSEALTQSSVASPQELDTLAAGGATDDGAERHSGEHAPPLDPAPLPADPAQVWQSPSSRRVSQLGLVVTLGLFGVIAATVAFVQFARSWNRPADQVAAVSPAEQAPVGEAVPGGDESATEAPTPDTDPEAEPPRDVSIADAAEGDRDSAEGDRADGADLAASAQPPEPLDSPQPPDAPQPTEPEEPTAATAEPVAPRPPETPEMPPGLDELPPGLRKFVPLLNRSIADNGAPQVFDTPPTIDSIRLDAAAGEGLDEEPIIKRPAVDIPRALAMRFAIDHDGITLAELMLLVSQLSGAAVEVELISLDLAGISTTETLKTAAGWMSIQQWLERSLAPAGMVAEVLDERVLVYASAQKIVEASGAALRLDDFGDSAADIARWIRPVVGSLDEEQVEEDAEDAWVFVEDEKRLDVPLDRAALIRTLLAAEAARKIHGLPGRLPRWQTARWMGPWSPEAGGRGDEQEGDEQPQAGKPPASADAIGDWPLVVEGATGPPLDSPRTAAGLLRQLGSENQVAIIVAWQDAMRNQFYPADLAMPYNDNLPAGALIDELIGESALQARDAGSDVWWIGSEALYDRYEVISWLTIPTGSGEKIARQFAEALGLDDVSALPVAWDETTLLVRAPRYLARQLSRLTQP